MAEAPKNIATSAFLNQQKKRVDQYLLDIYKAVPKEVPQLLTSAQSQTLLSGGKRLRPILAIAAFRLFSDDDDLVLGPACALELIHTGSLMLDDLPSMDDASLRRGQPTSHMLHGESTTILASAALWVKAFDILAATDSPRLNELVSLTAQYIGERGLILGQYQDLFELGSVVELPVLARSYELKTAALFRLAVAYGSIMGGSSPEEQKQLDEYARHLGIAFQIRDDIIDDTQTEAESGKDAHKDAQNNKVNYVSLLGLDGARQQLREHTGASLSALQALNTLREVSKNTTVLESIVLQLSGNNA